jgi:hypothetical protein
MDVPLVPGVYLLTVALAPADDTREGFFDYRFDVLEFRIVGSPSCFLTGVVDIQSRLGHRPVHKAEATG